MEDEDAGFPDKHTALEVESKVKDFEQSKETTITPPKDLPKPKTKRKDMIHGMIYPLQWTEYLKGLQILKMVQCKKI